jgi:hypothetical protein
LAEPCLYVKLGRLKGVAGLAARRQREDIMRGEGRVQTEI